MTVVTIPRQLANEELVLISKKEYETMKHGQQLPSRTFKEVAMTKAQKLSFVRAEQNFIQGKSLTLDEFKRKLARRR